MTVVYVFLITACFFDYRENKIPNFVVAGLLIWGILKSFQDCGAQGVGIYSGKMVLAAGLLYPLFCLRMLGAGDVKLFGVLAGFFSISEFISVFILAIVIAALFSLIKMWKYHIFKERFYVFCTYIMENLKNGRISKYPGAWKRETGARIHLAGPILISILLFCECTLIP